MVQNGQQPRVRIHELTEVDVAESEFSATDLSKSSSFRPHMHRCEVQDVLPDTTSFESLAAQNGGLRKEAPRMVSGQSDIKNEEFSPINITRHNTEDGFLDYAAQDLLPKDLQDCLNKLEIGSIHYTTTAAEEPCLGCPEDMTAETEHLAHLGRFVNVHRGGLSHEGSFQKRLLSPSSSVAVDESALLREESMQASTPKQLPNMKKTRPLRERIKVQEAEVATLIQQTPCPSPSKLAGKVDQGSFGSPLKLFGTYDTFTNQKLLRRLSQFEDRDEASEVDMPEDSTYPELDEAFVAGTSPEKASKGSQSLRKATRSFSSFGDGGLDGFEFSEAVSLEPFESKLEEKYKENVSLPLHDPSTQTRFKFRIKPSLLLENGTPIGCRAKHVNATSTAKQSITVRTTTWPNIGSSGNVSDLPQSQRIENLEASRKVERDPGGKRLPRSPLKDPTPKRRRTLHKADIDHSIGLENDLEIASLKDIHQQMQSVIGKKRKDARNGDNQEAANPRILAMRQILHPRTPTPSRRSSHPHGRLPLHEISVVTEQDQVQCEKNAKNQAELEASDTLQLSKALEVSQQMFNDSRKGSVTTQDFLDEAKKIMAGIRGKARPSSSLPSVEESDSESDQKKAIKPSLEDEMLKDSYQESTQEPFSRPPSREGAAPLLRLPLRQDDPELLSHLRKYQEISDMDEIVASSVKSIATAKESLASVKKVEPVTEKTKSKTSDMRISHGHAINQPRNICVSENPEMQRKRKHSGSSGGMNGDAHSEADFPSYGSNGSSGQSTTQSVPTGSSRNSDSRRVIGPHTVSHLIPEQLAGMVFDRKRSIWVKRNSVGGLGGSQNLPPSDETEDDPFGDIPDLSVDQTEELQRIQAVADQGQQSVRAAHITCNDKLTRLNGPQRTTQNPCSNPSSGRRNEDLEPSSEPSQLTRLISGAAIASGPNTRITSWGNDQLPVVKKEYPGLKTQISGRTLDSAKFQIREAVESKSSINEDRLKHSTPERQRNIMITFSSPIASAIEPSQYEDEDSNDHAAGPAGHQEEYLEERFGNDNVIIHERNDSSPKSMSTRKRTPCRSTSTRLSVGRHTFPARPISRIDECDEHSTNEDKDEQDQRSVSVIIATPMASKQPGGEVAITPRPLHEIGIFSLTPMSNFTIHNADESFGMEISYLVEGRRYLSGNQVKRTLSLSIKQLVEKISEIEPYEPFWEHIKQIDLKDNKLTNLHKLDEFCEQLEELDVSKNQISQLNGAPKSLRHLRITHNALTDLTAWGHLSNLQYIDVSNNELESLSAFRNLVHLRSLRADNNKVKSLYGIHCLDGLLSVRLRGNLVESLDFAGTKLQRLLDLDLRDNHIHDVNNLKELHSLSTIDLENNDLSRFPLEYSEHLRYLKLGGNKLESIDISQCPNLRLLYLDRNRLRMITGLLKTKYLDSLSMREQQEGIAIRSASLDEALEVRKLFLSGNFLHVFMPRVHFLNVQYLELANCGLERLPPNFGEIASNTRVLNLNFNALRDIRPLLGIVRLKKLYLVGNRLSRLRRTSDVLAQFSTLSTVDLRSNPLTQGFYSPMRETYSVQREVENDKVDRFEPFTLRRADKEQDVKYVACLDMRTRMLRRVYEMLVVGGSLRPKILDGLSIDRSVLNIKDNVWDELVRAGIFEFEPATALEG